MSKDASWEARHASLWELSQLPAVVQCYEEAHTAVAQLPQTDENAAATSASHAWSARLVDGRASGEQLGQSLDVSMAILGSVPAGASETQTLRLAWPKLCDMRQASLCDSNRDFISLNCLESNREGTVELVRCRFNRQIYVLKSTTKGSAKRGYRSNAPMTERRLLSLSRGLRKGSSCFTPSCIAAFQSSASLHVLMEYCPAGDLYHFLESAGQASSSNEARNSSGGLLSERYVRAYAVDIVAAIAWLHRQGYMHRDIKPGNWLFDRSGHLLLCDLASSAPFATFDEIPASASLPDRHNGQRSIERNQRRVLYRHCCLIGTADYIAPEIFWAADLMSRRKQRQYESSSNIDASTTLVSHDRTFDDGEDDDEPPPEGPGLYGPECDWWSVGVMLYEMVYKKLPFFSEKIADTMEMIKDHEKHFQQDARIECSAQLRDLVARLISGADKRLGENSSDDVQAHPYFCGVDWDRPWMLPSPFVPQLQNLSDSGDSSSLPQPELSVLHSPRATGKAMDSDAHASISLGPGNWSKLWADHTEDFPIFPNSAELTRAIADEPHISQVRFDGVADISEPVERSPYSTFDPTWIGFSYVPDENAFDAQVESDYSHVSFRAQSSSPASAAHLSSSAAAEDLTAIDADSIAPMTSTPPHVSKAEAVVPDSLLSAMKPRDSLHRHAMQTATRLRASSNAGRAIDGRFVTPMRKPSFSSISTAYTHQNDGVLHPGVPPSPYPFPIATTAKRPTHAPVPGTVLRRRDLDRARSASASAGEGSDSRCSGGSNAKREISEREAWYELKIAVMQSARKGNWNEAGESGHVRSEDESRLESVGGDESHIPKRALDRLQRRASDTHASVRSQDNPLVKHPFARRPGLARFLSDDLSRQPLEPILDTTPPHPSADPPRSPASSHSSTSPISLRSISITEQSIVVELAPPTARVGFERQRSARQLLLKAQHRDTPTRIARTATPLLTEPLGGTLARKASAVDTLTHVAQAAAVSEMARQTQDVANARLPGAVTKVKQMNRRVMRRRDSHEMLSQYRQGINPDEEFPPRTDSNEAVSAKPSTAYDLPRPASNTVRPGSLVVAASSMPTARLTERPLSSPSLPVTTDAFSEAKKKNVQLRVVRERASQSKDRRSVDETRYDLSDPDLSIPARPQSATFPRRRGMLPLHPRDENTATVQHAPRHSTVSQEHDDLPSISSEATSSYTGRTALNTKLVKTMRRSSEASSSPSRVDAGADAEGSRQARHVAKPVAVKEVSRPMSEILSGRGGHKADASSKASRPMHENSIVSVYGEADTSLDSSPRFASLVKRYDRLQTHISQMEASLERLRSSLQKDV